MTAPLDHWHLHARRWALVGPPLRPSAEDVAVVERAAAAWVDRASRPPRVLLLGSTAELAEIAWPAGTRLVAVDRSLAMLHEVLPRGTGAAVAADWCALPLAAASVDVVLGDGALVCLPYPAGYRALAGELSRVVAPGGSLVLRLFATPSDGEPLVAVAAALRAGAIGSFHALKWRIAMALAVTPTRSVAVAEIVRAFDQMVPDRDALPWPADVVGTIDHYRGSGAVYSFPTRAEAVAALGPDLVVERSVTPRYELGDRCPTLVFGFGTR
jgi:SAM-dependent methyltransferase